MTASPFAVLAATPQTRLDELQELASRREGPEAATAARLLSVPRSRLPAELAFLPGAAPTATSVLDALRDGRRPDLATLPQAARANVVAHLCAAGLASQDEQDTLALLQPALGDSLLADAIDADRATAGFPPIQRPAMLAEQELLADRHAAALVHACSTAAAPPARLAELIRAAPDGVPAGFMRRVAAAWARNSVGDLARVEETAAEAERELQRTPDPAVVERLIAAVQSWAALTAPQRASDARAGLDSPAAIRMVRTWRSAGVRLADQKHADLALPLARAMAACFADLPGEAARLADDVRDCASRSEDLALESRLTPLRALTERLSSSAASMEALSTDLLKSPFGPGAQGVAAELWTAFDAAAAACVQSEAPWAILGELSNRLGGEHKTSGAASALILQRGMAARAEAAGFTGLAERVRAAERGLERAAAMWRYTEAGDPAKPRGFYARRRALVALRAALPLVDDPTDRATLMADQQKLLRIRRNGRIASAVMCMIVVAMLAAWQLDDNYSTNAPYLQAAPRSLASPSSAPSSPSLSSTERAPAPGIMAGVQPAPFPPMPAFVDPDAGAGPAKDPPPANAGTVVPLAFPTKTVLPERQPPRGTDRVRTLPEVRWCEFNKIRLQAAMDAATDAQEPAVRSASDAWLSLCASYSNTRRDEERVAGEVDRFHARLEAEGHTMLNGASP